MVAKRSCRESSIALAVVLCICSAVLVLRNSRGPLYTAPDLGDVNDSRPRVAVCTRGTLRYYRQGHESFVRHVERANPQYRFDHFIYTSEWVDGSTGKFEPFKVNQTDVLLRYKPLRSVFEKATVYDKNFGNKEFVDGKEDRTHQQLERISRCYELVDTYSRERGTPYVWVLNMRSDLMFSRPLRIGLAAPCTYCIHTMLEWSVVPTSPSPPCLTTEDTTCDIGAHGIASEPR